MNKSRLHRKAAFVLIAAFKERINRLKNISF